MQSKADRKGQKGKTTMTVCVCIDDSCGISFGGKRQSKDKLLVARLLELAEGKRIFIKEYSAKLFAERCESVFMTEDFSDAGADDICFVEIEDASKYFSQADGCILYRWNRRYPSDIKLSDTPEKFGFALKSTYDFAGNSHDKITEEVWSK